ncbi:MAG TPA: hypothetical protein VM690_03190 [Gaiellaceae bacterium]|nr:hypothetical protein [Gaiellaceae bacterium]
MIHCPVSSIGPGSLHRGGIAGAACLVRAYDDGCRAADYTLSALGVDTIHSRTFTLSKNGETCVVRIVESFRVVPQKPRETAHYTCLRLRPYVADRCTPKATLSLTRF